MVTNIDFEAWGEYLGDPPLAMAFLDRIVDGAIILKIKGKSFRAHRAQHRIAKQPNNRHVGDSQIVAHFRPPTVAIRHVRTGN